MNEEEEKEEGKEEEQGDKKEVGETSLGANLGEEEEEGGIIEDIALQIRIG